MNHTLIIFYELYDCPEGSKIRDSIFISRNLNFIARNSVLALLNFYYFYWFYWLFG